MIFHGPIYVLLFNPVLQYIFNESRACSNLGWAFGTSASMFWHISLTLVDLPFDNLTTPSPSIYEFGLTIQAKKLHKLLWHATSEFIIFCGVGGHGFFGLDWISFDIEHAILFNCGQLLVHSPVTIALIALGRTLSLAEKTTQSC